MNPEEFGFDKYRPTKTSDCYALGMVIYEIISGHLLFHDHKDLTVFVKVLRGTRPRRGPGFTNNLWKMLELCWEPQPDARQNQSQNPLPWMKEGVGVTVIPGVHFFILIS